MAKTFRVRKPHDEIIEKALRRGIVEVPHGAGLYLSRLRDELDGVAIVRPRRRDVFEVICGEEIVERVSESSKYATFRRTGRRWRELI